MADDRHCMHNGVSPVWSMKVTDGHITRSVPPPPPYPALQSQRERSLLSVALVHCKQPAIDVVPALEIAPAAHGVQLMIPFPYNPELHMQPV